MNRNTTNLTRRGNSSGDYHGSLGWVNTRLKVFYRGYLSTGFVYKNGGKLFLTSSWCIYRFLGKIKENRRHSANSFKVSWSNFRKVFTILSKLEKNPNQTAGREQVQGGSSDHLRGLHSFGFEVCSLSVDPFWRPRRVDLSSLGSYQRVAARTFFIRLTTNIVWMV